MSEQATDTLSDMLQRQRALSRWDNEGGAGPSGSQAELHYAGKGLMDQLMAALAAAGLSGNKLSIADLAPLDQFHTRGLAATVELGIF